MDMYSSALVEIDVSLGMDSDKQRTKRRKKSMVWDHFTTEIVGSGITKACCKHCNKSFAYMSGNKTSGTSHLKRHIELGICENIRDIKKLTPTPKKHQISSPESKKVLQIKDGTNSCPPKKSQISFPNVPLYQDRCNHEMAKMIIVHDYPLHMVEHPGFIGFVQALRPQFSVPSFNTIHGDCVTMFLSQKQKVLDFIGEIPGGVNLTVELWSSNQSVGYAFVSGHFVDKDWNLAHRLLNVAVVASPDSDSALNQAIAACLSEWKLEGKVLSLAVSQSVVNKTSIDNLRGFLSVRNQHVLNGQFLMGECYARILSSMAQDVLTAEQLQEPIKKVRHCIKCIKTNENCGERFDELKKQFPTSISNKDLFIDNQTRWDTSYNMLLAAWEHRQLFSSLETCHPEYKLSISPEDWRKIESICSCLKVLFEAGNFLSRPNQLTANDLYHEMTNIQLQLNNNAMNEDSDVRDLVNSLREKFDQYWRGCFLVLAVAVVMDPRFKMQLIEFTFNKLYGEAAEKWTKTVDDAFHDLYLNYSEQNLLDAYEDHGFSDIEMTRETHFHQEMAEDDNTGNGQLGDETIPQVESHEHENQRTEEDQRHCDDPQAHATTVEVNMSSPDIEGTQDQDMAEDANTGNGQLGDETIPQVESHEQENQRTEEDQQHCDDPQAHPTAEEDNTSFLGTEVTQELHFHQDMTEHDNTGNGQLGDETSPQVESHEHEKQLEVDKQNEAGLLEGVNEESQRTEEDQQHCDDSQAHATAEEVNMSFPDIEGTQDQDMAEADNTGNGQLGDETRPQVESHFHQDMSEDANTANGQLVDETSPQVESLEHENHQTEKDQQHCDDSQAHALTEEDNTSFPVDVLLDEGSTLITIGESLSDLEMYISEMKTELDQYLQETLIPRSDDLNVLNWWRLNSTNYPTLSKMASDILSVPFTTVSPDSVFSTEVKLMDSYKTSLPRVTLEALFCTKDWLKNGAL